MMIATFLYGSYLLINGVRPTENLGIVLFSGLTILLMENSIRKQFRKYHRLQVERKRVISVVLGLPLIVLIILMLIDGASYDGLRQEIVKETPKGTYNNLMSCVYVRGEEMTTYYENTLGEIPRQVCRGSGGKVKQLDGTYKHLHNVYYFNKDRELMSYDTTDYYQNLPLAPHEQELEEELRKMLKEQQNKLDKKEKEKENE